ncbi:MAG: formylmethanofuran dehydrogenase [Chloroflexi bacterium]|nr:MAG: formylmethanofuran dehydrogenase [Chloroflexota bacterium]
MLKLAELVRERDLEGVMEAAREFHGHICPYVALGVRASTMALDELGAERLDSGGSVEEALLAIVECNNCFVDGVQVTTGCTLGNNSLIYFDLGKNALTLVRRGSWEGVRLYVDSERLREEYFSEEATELFEKVVTRRSGTPQDAARLKRLWEEIGRQMLELPREMFKIDKVRLPPVELAPIFKSLRCSQCGELAMETRMVYVDEKPLCFKCAGRGFHALIGRGIVDELKK